MKKWSLIFNIVLLVLVGILFYLHFAPARGKVATAPPADSLTEQQSRLPLAYINVDSLEAHYTYFQKRKAELDKKQESVQNELASKARDIQADIAKLQKNAPTLTQSEGMAAQKKIVEKRQKLQEREQQLRTELLQQQQQFNQELHNRLQRFLEKYNADKHYAFIFSYSEAMSDILYKKEAYNITAEVIQGLNAEKEKASE